MEETLRAQLRPGEQLLWMGKPDPTKVLNWADIYNIPFSVIWTAIALYMSVTTMMQAELAALSIFLWLFVLFGFYIMFGRFWVLYLNKKKTVYGVTNLRILLCTGKKATSIYYPMVPSVQRKVKKDGTGTVTIGKPSFNQRIYGNNSMSVSLLDKDNACVLMDIENVEQVYGIICAQMEQCRMAPPPYPIYPPPYVPPVYPPNNGQNNWENRR